MTKEESISRSRRFEHLLNHKPEPGDILTPMNGESIALYVDRKVDFNKVDTRSKRAKEIFTMYCNAAIDREAKGWFLTNELTGLKCLIMPQSQESLLSISGGKIEGLAVTKLRVVRHNRNGTALICEVI